MQNVNPTFQQEKAIAAIEGAIWFLHDAKQKQLNRLFGRIPSGRLDHNQAEINGLVTDAITRLQEAISPVGDSTG